MSSITKGEELLFDTLVDKTAAGKINWKLEGGNSFSFSIKKWKLIVTNSFPNTLLSLYEEDIEQPLTTYIACSTNLYRLAGLYCEERQKALEEAIRILKEL